MCGGHDGGGFGVVEVTAADLVVVVTAADLVVVDLVVVGSGGCVMAVDTHVWWRRPWRPTR